MPHHDVDHLLVGIELRLRIGLDVGVAFVAVHRAHRLQILGELGAVEDVAALGADHLAQVAAPADGLDLASRGVALVNPELTDVVLRALR